MVKGVCDVMLVNWCFDIMFGKESRCLKRREWPRLWWKDCVRRMRRKDRVWRWLVLTVVYEQYRGRKWKKSRPSFDAIHPLDIQGNKKRTNLINSVCILQARALKVSPQQPTGAGPVPSPPAKQKVAATDAKAAQQTDEILNSILPPRYGSLTSNSHLKCVYLYNMLFAYKCLV